LVFCMIHGEILTQLGNPGLGPATTARLLARSFTQLVCSRTDRPTTCCLNVRAAIRLFTRTNKEIFCLRFDCTLKRADELVVGCLNSMHYWQREVVLPAAAGFSSTGNPAQPTIRPVYMQLERGREGGVVNTSYADAFLIVSGFSAVRCMLRIQEL
jgi:hypothetical protein